MSSLLDFSLDDKYLKEEGRIVLSGLQALVRGKAMPVTVTKLPFVQQRYYRG